MAYHLPAWPPVGTTEASLMAFSYTVEAWLLAIAHFGATVAGQSVMGLRSCSTCQCWLSIPMWNLNLQLRRIAIQKWRQQRSRICSVRHQQRWLPSFMARTTYGIFLPLWFSTMTAAVSTSTTKSPMNSYLLNASVRSGPSSTALSLPAQNNAAAPISSLMNLTGHFPKAYLIGPMTGSPSHKASTCGAATCWRWSWALRCAARFHQAKNKKVSVRLIKQRSREPHIVFSRTPAAREAVPSPISYDLRFHHMTFFVLICPFWVVRLVTTEGRDPRLFD